MRGAWAVGPGRMSSKTARPSASERQDQRPEDVGVLG